VQHFKNDKETNSIGLLGCYRMAEWAKANKIGIEKAKQYSLHSYLPIQVWGYNITALLLVTAWLQYGYRMAPDCLPAGHTLTNQKPTNLTIAA